MKIINTIIDKLSATGVRNSKMERKLWLLETYSSRSQENSPLFC